MAKCTLDDLVPSIKCKRVFLEPLGTSYSEYQVQIEACVYDSVVEEGDGIADYLLTDQFRKLIKCCVLYSRDASLENFINFLTLQTSLPNWGVTQIIYQSITEWIATADYAGKSDDEILQSIESEMKQQTILDSYSQSIGTTGGLEEQSMFQLYINLLWDIGKAIRDNRIDAVNVDFESYSSDFIANHYANYGKNYGEITLDEDGNRVYELLLPRADLVFKNDVAVEHCYAHMFCFLSLEDYLNNQGFDTVGSSLTESQRRSLNSYSYSPIHTCRILEYGLPASPVVQDFRSKHDKVLKKYPKLWDRINTENAQGMGKGFETIPLF